MYVKGRKFGDMFKSKTFSCFVMMLTPALTHIMHMIYVYVQALDNL